MKKLDLGGVKTASSSSRAAHPVVEVTDSETRTLLEQFTLINPQFKTLKNQSETLSKQLAAPIRRLFWSKWAGVEPESSTLLCVVGGKSVKLTVKNSYTKTVTDEAGLLAAIGEELTAKHFKQATVLKIDFDKIPDDRKEEFASKILADAEAMGCSDAVSASQCIQPVAGFHESRSSILTVEQNEAIDRIIPITAYPPL